MPNQYVNKVAVNGSTIIDLTGDTVTAADVAQGKTFHLASGASAVGTASGSSSGAFSDVIETLPNGGEHHIITGVDISADTVTASHLEAGYTAHDAQGNAITGTLSPSGGGGSSFTLIGSKEYAIESVSSSATSIGSFKTDLPHDTSKVLWIKIRNKEGKKNGYYYGSDNIHLYQLPTSVSSSKYYFAHNTSINSDGSTSESWQSLSVATAPYSGMYARVPHTDSNSDVVTVYVYAQYNSIYGQPISGTYIVEVYTLDYSVVG